MPMFSASKVPHLEVFASDVGLCLGNLERWATYFEFGDGVILNTVRIQLEDVRYILLNTIISKSARAQ